MFLLDPIVYFLCDCQLTYHGTNYNKNYIIFLDIKCPIGAEFKSVITFNMDLLVSCEKLHIL